MVQRRFISIRSLLCSFHAMVFVITFFMYFWSHSLVAEGESADSFVPDMDFYPEAKLFRLEERLARKTGNRGCFLSWGKGLDPSEVTSLHSNSPELIAKLKHSLSDSDILQGLVQKMSNDNLFIGPYGDLGGWFIPDWHYWLGKRGFPDELIALMPETAIIFHGKPEKILVHHEMWHRNDLIRGISDWFNPIETEQYVHRRLMGLKFPYSLSSIQGQQDYIDHVMFIETSRLHHIDDVTDGPASGRAGGVRLANSSFQDIPSSKYMRAIDELGQFKGFDPMARLDTLEGVLSAAGMSLDLSGQMVSNLAARHNHEGLLGTGVMMRWAGGLIMGQRPSHSDSGLPSLHEMFMHSHAVNRQASLARDILAPGARSNDLIAELHGGPSQVELNARLGYHPGWCPTKCSEACPNSYVPSWFGRRLGSSALPGSSFDRRLWDR